MEITLKLNTEPEKMAEQCHLYWEDSSGSFVCPVECFECPFKKDGSPCSLITAADWIDVCNKGE